MKMKSHIHDGRAFLVFQIDALHLTVALCRYTGSTCKVLDYVTYVSDAVMLEESTSVFSPAFRIACRTSLARLEEKTGETLPTEVVCITNRKNFLAQPFSYTFPRPQPRIPITYEELDDYVSLAQKKAHDQAKQSWSQRFLSDSRNMHVISSSIHALEVDKKVMLHPIGHIGEQVRLSFLYVFCTQGFFDTAFRFFEKQGLSLSAVIPRQIAHLNTFYTQAKFFEDYLILDFGYYTTSIIAHHGGRMQDFAILPVGAHFYEQILKSRSKQQKASLEHRSRIHDLEKFSGSRELQEYCDVLCDGLKMLFPSLETRISTKNVFVTGYYAYADILDRITEGELSPYVQPGCKIKSLIPSKKIQPDLHPITSLFSSKTLFSVYRDPLVNIFRSHLNIHEA